MPSSEEGSAPRFAMGWLLPPPALQATALGNEVGLRQSAGRGAFVVLARDGIVRAILAICLSSQCHAPRVRARRNVTKALSTCELISHRFVAGEHYNPIMEKTLIILCRCLHDVRHHKKQYGKYQQCHCRRSHTPEDAKNPLQGATPPIRSVTPSSREQVRE
jgi:hypothetical protein